MADVYKGLTVKIGADTSSLSSALRKARSEVSGVASDLRKVEKALKLDPGNVKLLAQQQKDYQRQIESTKKQLELFRQAEKQLEEVDAFTPEQEAQWTKLQSDIVVTEQKLKGYKQALAESIVQQGVASSALGKFGSGIETLGSHVQGFGRGIETVGRGLTSTLTPAVFAVGAASVAAAVEIDTALTGVRKTVDGTEEQYQELKRAAIDFSKTNAVSASQILDIQALGAQLGFTIEELDEFGQIVSGLDIATNMDAETAATEMAQFANITKMSHEEISNFGSAIVGLGNNFATTESDVSHMAMRVAAAATQVGMSQADILGLSTALASMGVEAEAGGTAISTIMAQIDKDIALSGEVMAGTSDMAQKDAEKVVGALETWASTAGMTAEEFAAAWKEEPVDALAALLTNMENATAEGGNVSVMLEELGIDSIRQTDIMKRLAGNSELVGKAVAKANEEWDANTALAKEVENRNESLSAKFEMLKNRAIAIAEEFGGPLANALLDVIDDAEPLIKMISDGAKQFSEMSKSEQQAVLKAVALSAALGPMLNLFGKGVKSIEPFGAGLRKIAEFFAKVDYKTSGASRGLKDYAGSTKTAESATKKATTAVKASSVALGAAKSAALGVAGILAGMLLASIVGVANGIAEAKKRGDEIEATNRALSESLGGLETGASGAAGSLDSYGMTAESVKGKANDLKDAHADLAKSLSDSMTEAGASVGMLDSYVSTIDELGTKSNLTQEEQARLKDAVSKINDACGTTFEVTDDVNGALYGQVDAIHAVVAAQQDRLRYEAASEGLRDLYKQQEADLMEISRLEQQRNDLAEKHKGQTRAQWGEDAEVYNETVNALQEVMGQYHATSGAVEKYEARVGELGAAIGSSNEEMSSFVAENSAMASVLETTGLSAGDFAKALSQCGASTQDLASLSEEQLTLLAQSYDGNVQSIVEKLQEFGIVAKEEGAKAAENLGEGISDGAENAVAAAQEVTGLTIDQLKTDCARFGIVGEDSVNAYAAALASGSTKAEAAAIATGQAVTTGIEGQTPNAVQAMYLMKDGILQAYNPVTGELSAVTVDATDNIASSIVSGAPSAVGSIAAMKDGVVYAYDPITGNLSAITDAAMDGVAKSVANGRPDVVNETAALEKSAVDAISPIKKDLPDAGSEGSIGFGESLGDGNKKATTNAGSMAAAAMIMNMYARMFYRWGSHSSHNFANGIMSGYGAAVAAASRIANAVKDILGHSVPKSGPLRNGGKGEKEWGAHAAQNWIAGFQSEMPSLRSAMDEMAGVVSGAMGTGARSRASINVSAAASRAASAPQMHVNVDASGSLTKADVYEAVGEAMTKALRSQPDTVIKVDGREFARSARRYLA